MNEFKSGQIIIESTLYNNYPLIKGDFNENYLQVNGVLDVSELIKLQPMVTAPVCAPTENYGGIYFNGNTDKLNVCIINPTGQGQWVPLN